MILLNNQEHKAYNEAFCRTNYLKKSLIVFDFYLKFENRFFKRIDQHVSRLNETQRHIPIILHTFHNWQTTNPHLHTLVMSVGFLCSLLRLFP